MSVARGHTLAQLSPFGAANLQSEVVSGMLPTLAGFPRSTRAEFPKSSSVEAGMLALTADAQAVSMHTGLTLLPGMSFLPLDFDASLGHSFGKLFQVRPFSYYAFALSQAPGGVVACMQLGLPCS